MDKTKRALQEVEKGMELEDQLLNLSRSVYGLDILFCHAFERLNDGEAIGQILFQADNILKAMAGNILKLSGGSVKTLWAKGR